MSVQRVQAEVLGETVEGTVVERIPTPDFGTGPAARLVLDVDGSRYRVDESDALPR